MLELLRDWLLSQGISAAGADMLNRLALLGITLVLACLVGWGGRKLLVPTLEKLTKKSSNTWDDALAAHHFFRRLAGLLPVVLFFLAIDLLFVPGDPGGILVRRLTLTLFVVLAARLLVSFLGAAQVIYEAHDLARERPIKGYLQLLQILLWVLVVILAVAILTGKSPWGVLSVLGGLTAILLLVFKDTILGFVASLQLSGNDMALIGDWIEMPQFGADGDVIDVSIHTVKVRNWDKTITTIPTYALVSGSFKNWRGMAESGGRRIKRLLFIDMASIGFCDQEMLARFGRYQLLGDYLANRQAEIDTFNREHGVDTSTLVNGRRQTNIGVFRAYVVSYLRAHPQINQEMTFLVRHLEPTPQGLPLEIYVFSKDKVWANYEAIQADIFDHLLAVLPEFGLRVFQYPTGHDLAGLSRLRT
jgi:miniconductance mechanosensitive channel